MLEYLGFLRRRFPLLAYGLVFSFFSSFGQTFLVSLFVPSFLTAFALSQGHFGSLYAVATLGSALLLPWGGSWLDRVHLTRFSTAVVVLLAVSAFVIALAWHPLVLLLGLLGIRLAGQGLSGQAAMTAMARYFGTGRGRALSISGLGFPLGEAVLPLLVVGSIGLVGWRWSWALVGVLALVLFAPTLAHLLHRTGLDTDPRLARPVDDPVEASVKVVEGEAVAAGEEAVAGVGEGSEDGGLPAGKEWSRAEVLRDRRLLGLLPAALLPSFWITGVFLYQTEIARLNGWSLALAASAFLAYAVARVVASLGAGGVVDRISATRLFPLSPIPLAAGFGLLLLFQGRWVAFGYMACLGVAMGIAATAKPALWAELYGIRFLGSIKSMMATLMVLSTAASPPLLGFMLDAGISLDWVLLAGVVSAAGSAPMAWWVLRCPSPPGRPLKE